LEISDPITEVPGHFTEAIWWSGAFIITIIMGGTISSDTALALDILPLPTDQAAFMEAALMAAGVMAAGVTAEPVYLFSVVFSHQRTWARTEDTEVTEVWEHRKWLRGSFVAENRHGSGSSITKKSSVTSVPPCEPPLLEREKR
jgi:hypothetical protein